MPVGLLPSGERGQSSIRYCPPRTVNGSLVGLSTREPQQGCRVRLTKTSQKSPKISIE